MGQETKSRQLNIRVSSEEIDRWREVAGPRNLARWVRETLNEASLPLPAFDPEVPSEDHSGNR